MNTIGQNFISDYKAAYEKKMARAIKKVEKLIAKIDEYFSYISSIPTVYDAQMERPNVKNRIDICFKDHRFDGEIFNVAFWGRNFANANIGLCANSYRDGEEIFDYCSSVSFDDESFKKALDRMFDAIIDKNTKECDAVLDKIHGRA